MARPPLTIVGGSGKAESEPDAVVAEAEKIAAALVGSTKAGFGYWVMLDGDPPKAVYCGSRLEMSALAEEIARDMKLDALGFGR
jgi:hypothetical protein